MQLSPGPVRRTEGWLLALGLGLDGPGGALPSLGCSHSIRFAGGWQGNSEWEVGDLLAQCAGALRGWVCLPRAHMGQTLSVPQGGPSAFTTRYP